MHEKTKAIRTIVPAEVDKMVGGKKAKHLLQDWDTFKSLFLIPFGINIIQYKDANFHTPGFLPLAIQKWVRNSTDCPYFNEWATGMLYLTYYSMFRNHKLDENAQSDVQTLLYLNYADALISEEKKFIQHAYDDLYKPRNKLYLSVDELKKI